MEARAGNSILDFEILFSDFQELLNGSGLTSGPFLRRDTETEFPLKIFKACTLCQKLTFRGYCVRSK